MEITMEAMEITMEATTHVQHSAETAMQNVTMMNALAKTTTALKILLVNVKMTVRLGLDKQVAMIVSIVTNSMSMVETDITTEAMEITTEVRQ